MKKTILTISILVFIFYAYGYTILKYLILFSKSKKKWTKIDAKIIDNKAFPRSFGIIPCVEFYCNDTKIIAFTYEAYFTRSDKIGNKINVLYNPYNPEQCLINSKKQYILNLLSLVFLTLICIGGSIFLLLKIISN
jgi:hypothetical protein